MNGIKINVSHIATQFGCTEDEANVMIDYWGYGDGIYTVREMTSVAPCSEPTVRKVTEYITAATSPSNNSLGAQWYGRHCYKYYERDRLTEEKYAEFVRLIPARSSNRLCSSSR